MGEACPTLGWALEVTKLEWCCIACNFAAAAAAAKGKCAAEDIVTIGMPMETGPLGGGLRASARRGRWFSAAAETGATRVSPLGRWEGVAESDDPLVKILGTTVAGVRVVVSSVVKKGSCLSLAGEAQLVYLGAVISNFLTSTSKAVGWPWLLGLLLSRLSSMEISEEAEAKEGGLLMISAAAADSLPSLLDLESTLRLFNLRLWNKLIVMGDKRSLACKRKKK